MSSVYEPGLYHLVANPTPETLQRLHQILGGSPIHIEWEKLCLCIASSSDQQDLPSEKKGVLFKVNLTSFQIEFNSQLNRTELVARTQSVPQDDGSKDDDYGMNIVFYSHVAMARTNRAFINSVNDTLAYREPPFTFQDLHVVHNIEQQEN